MRLALIVCAVLAVGAGAAWSSSLYTFTPATGALQSLDHSNWYTWGIDLADQGWWQSGHQIIGARLTISNLYDWQKESNALYVQLLDWAPTGVTSGTDTNTGLSDYFNSSTYGTTSPWQTTTRIKVGRKWQTIVTGQESRLHTALDTYTDADGPATKGTWTYNFTTAEIDAFNQYTSQASNDSRFGIGLDPDCHYYDSGMKLEIITNPEPSVGLLGLLGAGVIGFVVRRRKGANGTT